MLNLRNLSSLGYDEDNAVDNLQTIIEPAKTGLKHSRQERQMTYRMILLSQGSFRTDSLS